MQIKIFDLSAQGSEEEQDKFNKFIRSQKVVDIDRQFYLSSDNIGHWSVFVTYIPNIQQSLQSNSNERREKIDYKELLSEEEFDKFVKLRSIRKKIANDDAVPAYAVFTDAELSQIARMPNVESGLMRQITGIGEKRIEKYGNLLCAYYNKIDETSGTID